MKVTRSRRAKRSRSRGQNRYRRSTSTVPMYCNVIIPWSCSKSDKISIIRMKKAREHDWTPRQPTQSILYGEAAHSEGFLWKRFSRDARLPQPFLRSAPQLCVPSNCVRSERVCVCGERERELLCGALTGVFVVGNDADRPCRPADHTGSCSGQASAHHARSTPLCLASCCVSELRQRLVGRRRWSSPPRRRSRWSRRPTTTRQHWRSSASLLL